MGCMNDSATMGDLAFAVSSMCAFLWSDRGKTEKQICGLDFYIIYTMHFIVDQLKPTDAQ
jgi:hypothetical protein